MREYIMDGVASGRRGAWLPAGTSCVDILRRGLPASQRVLWIVVVIVFPIVGLLVYFTLRKPTEAEVRAAQAAAADRRDR
jgi:hypothetical protein